MKNVFILTESGSSYTDQGCDFITERVRKTYGDDSELTFGSGAIFNDAEHLAKCIDDHPDCYVTISTKDNVITICKDAVEKLREDLKGANGKTSWEVAVAMIEEIKNA